MENQEQRYYDPNKLHKIFTFTAFGFLISLVAMFYHDYDREWRVHQARFRDLDVQKTRKELSQEESRLAGEEEFGRLKTQLDSARKELSGRRDELDRLSLEVSTLTKERDAVREEMNFQKAERDAVKYEFEKAREKGSASAAGLQNKLGKFNEAVRRFGLAVDGLETRIAHHKTALGQVQSATALLERQMSDLTARTELMKRKLEALDAQRMSPLNRLADLVRDLPGLDMLNPRYNVRQHQLIVNGITEDLIFTRVPRVDRCLACHMGMINQNFKDEGNPVRSHPNLDLFLTQSSPHPLKEFGCTSCHSGRGRGTSFKTSAHMPDTQKQREQWQGDHRWDRLHHWDHPMYPARYTQAGCYKCHPNDPELVGADKLNLGLAIVRKAGCNGCHLIDRFNDEPKAGPSLRRIPAKVSMDWAFNWIKDPKSFQKHTWMPSFFKQSNNLDIEARTDAELHAIVHYLFTRNDDPEPRGTGTGIAEQDAGGTHPDTLTTAPDAQGTHPVDLRSPPLHGRGLVPDAGGGNADNGKRLVMARGCQACHMLKDDQFGETLTVDSMRRQQGPRLVGLGTKTNPDWLFRWLKDPAAVASATLMPNLRLSDEEVRDITAYLIAENDGEKRDLKVPAVDDKLIDEITLELIAKDMTFVAAQEKLKSMGSNDKLAYTGKKMIRHYGCFGCHDIPGFEDEQPIGTDLSEEGSKPLAQLDFGLRHDVEHVNHAWFEQKLKDPRSFDHGLEKIPGERLRMPNFGFDAQSIQAIVTCLLAFAKPDTDLKKAISRNPRNIFIEEGEKLITRLNCRGCHVINRSGGAIRPSIVKWAAAHPPGQEASHEPKKEDGQEDGQEAGKEPGQEDEGDDWGDTEEEAIDPQVLAQAYSPPDLAGEGAKVRPQWLFDFLADPTPIRPWFEVRMPTYSLTDAERNTILRYFNYLERQSFPFEKPVAIEKDSEDYKAGARLFSPAVMNCTSCHVVAGKPPAGKTAAEWAPDLGMARNRLKADWVLKWLTDPQALTPGTKMPQYWPKDEPSPLADLEGDSLRQRKAMRDYLMTLEN